MEGTLLIPLKQEIWHMDKFKEILTRFLTYPKNDIDMARDRFKVLMKYGLDAFILEGPVKVGDINLLGKGTNSLVVKGIFKKEIVAVKILRLDSSRSDLLNEVNILSHLKGTEITPQIITHSKWFIIEEYIDGILIGDFFYHDIYLYNKKEIDQLISGILSKSFKLDQLRIDHGELSRADKHIIIDDELNPYIIDFESASLSRTPKNITSICHYLFVASYASEYLRLLYNIELDTLKHILKIYKKNFSPESFRHLMRYLGLKIGK